MHDADCNQGNGHNCDIVSAFKLHKLSDNPCDVTCSDSDSYKEQNHCRTFTLVFVMILHKGVINFIGYYKHQDSLVEQEYCTDVFGNNETSLNVESISKKALDDIESNYNEVLRAPAAIMESCGTFISK